MDASFDDDNNNNIKRYLCNGDEEQKTLKIPAHVAKSRKIKLLTTSPTECLNTQETKNQSSAAPKTFHQDQI
jgi:hypothetical protein